MCRRDASGSSEVLLLSNMETWRRSYAPTSYLCQELVGCINRVGISIGETGGVDRLFIGTEESMEPPLCGAAVEVISRLRHGDVGDQSSVCGVVLPWGVF